MSTGRITAANAPAIAAMRLGITEGEAAGRIEQNTALQPVREGMRHWYDREAFEAWLDRQQEARASVKAGSRS